MGAALVWARTQWRQRWAALVLAALVLALSGALALAAASRAHRSVGAFDRLRERSSASDVWIQIEDEQLRADPEAAVRRVLSKIDATGAAIELRFFIRPIGSSLVPTYQFFPVVEHQLLNQPTNVSVLVSGQLPDPTVGTEIALSRQMADELGVHVGDTVPFESASPDWVDVAFSGADAGPLDGPILHLSVTGIVVSPLDFSAPKGAVYLTPAFEDAYAARIFALPFVDLRLADPHTAEQMIRTGSLHTGDPQLDAGFSVTASSWSDLAQVSDGLMAAATALWLFAGVVAVAGIAAFALLFRRLALSLNTELATLGALGTDRSLLVSFGAVLVAPVVVLGAAAAALGAVALSSHVGVGVIDQVDPQRGHLPDATLMTIGLAMLIVLALAVAVPPFTRLRRKAAEANTAVRHPALRRPLELSLGVRNALSGNDGTVSGKATVVAGASLMAMAVVGLVAAGSLSVLPRHPALWGGGSGATIDFGERQGGEPNEPYDRALDSLSDDQRVGAVMGTTVFYPSVLGTTANAQAIDTRRGDTILTVLAGRPPRGPDEMVMGRATMRRLGLQLGDVVPMKLGRATESFRLVGQVAFPVGDFAFDDGQAVSLDGARRFPGFATGNHTYQVLVTWADGVDRAAATEGLKATFGDQVTTATPLPPAVTNLHGVQPLPTLLAVFFGSLALIVVAYVLAVSRRSRQRQYAVLAALGLRRRSAAAVVGWQAVTLGACACVIGVPAGAIAGRALWTAIAHRAGVAVEHDLSLNALTIAVAVAIVGPLGISMLLHGLARGDIAAQSLRAD